MDTLTLASKTANPTADSAVKKIPIPSFQASENANFPLLSGFAQSPKLEIPAISDLGNTLAEVLENIHTLLSFGVKLHFPKDGLSSADAKFKELIGTLDLIAEENARRMTERVLSVREERSEDGDPVCVSSYGYKRMNGVWAVEPSEAKRVKTAFYLASQCACYMYIRKADSQVPRGGD